MVGGALGACLRELGGDGPCHGPPLSRPQRATLKNAETKLAAGDGADDEEWLGAGGYFGWKQGVRRFVRKIFRAGEEAEERAPLQRVVISDCAAQHGIARFEFIEHRAQRWWNGEFESDLAVHMSQRAEMRGEYDTNHGSVCTSTDKTAGKSRTIGAQESPALEEAYTWPPLVPK